MQNLLPTLFIALAALALVLTLLWLWQSLRLAFVHTLAAPSTAAVSQERAALLAEKQSLLLALKDLEAEREAGKLSVADFNDLNAQYRKRAREVLHELDTLLAPHRGEAKALLAAASGNPAAPGAVAPAVPEPAVAASAACADCGTHNDPDAVFCKKCGKRLRAESGA